MQSKLELQAETNAARRLLWQCKYLERLDATKEAGVHSDVCVIRTASIEAVIYNHRFQPALKRGRNDKQKQYRSLDSPCRSHHIGRRRVQGRICTRSGWLPQQGCGGIRTGREALPNQRALSNGSGYAAAQRRVVSAGRFAAPGEELFLLRGQIGGVL